MKTTLLLAVSCALLHAAQLTTIVGTGQAGSSGGRIDQPFGLAVGPDGALWFCEVGNHRISRLDLKTRVLSVAAGTGLKGNSGDGGPAAAARMDEPYEIAFDQNGNVYFCDRTNHVIRRIDRQSGRIDAVAGTSHEGFAGDGGPGLRAQFRQPHSIAFTPDGLLLICDILNFRIRSWNPVTDVIDTWAGVGTRGLAGDSAPLRGSPLDGPRALAIDRHGNYYLALREGNAVYRLDVAGNRMIRFAGTGAKGYSGDGGDARQATLSGPKGIACAPDGSLNIADTENHAIRRVDVRGVITTVAGTGERGDGPDGDPHKARLARPHGVFADGEGALFIADTENHRIRVLKP